ncbi:MAG: hypothetical protein HY319_20075 [Armatimonadetes bacterium]|nr:hypothetical protein [Armatimonadota bacterium]
MPDSRSRGKLLRCFGSSVVVTAFGDRKNVAVADQDMAEMEGILKTLKF